jgi:glycosyltransferase involved in cell wall biosynthesis
VVSVNRFVKEGTSREGAKRIVFPEDLRVYYVTSRVTALAVPLFNSGRCRDNMWVPGYDEMKVLFLIQGFQVAASRYRVLQYLPFIQEAGIETEVLQFPARMSGWASLYDTLKAAGTIFVQRKRLPLPILMLLKGLGKKIIYDFDDAVMFKNSLAENPYSTRRRLSFKRMLRYTDLVIAGNEFLKEEAEKYHGRVRVLPTPVDAERYRPKAYPGGAVVNIGWIGDHGSIHYMESYKDVWEEVGERFENVMLTIICDTFIETGRIRLNKVRWNLEREIDDLHSLDIGVMPLFDDLWSRGKCGFKIIQYLGVGVPAICTPVGINRDVVVDGVSGFWAVSRREWVEKLSTLIGDAGMRERMGKAGRRKIMEGYTVQACAPRLIEWIRETA